MTCDRNVHQRMLSKKCLNTTRGEVSSNMKIFHVQMAYINTVHQCVGWVLCIVLSTLVFQPKDFQREQFAFFHFYLVSWYITIQRERMAHHFLHLQRISTFFNDSFTHFFPFRKYLMNFLNIQNPYSSNR